MKKILVLLAIFMTVNLYAVNSDTLKLTSKIKDITVFLDGAQIARQANMELDKGRYLMMLENLPAEINPQSIQIDNNQNGEIRSVKHEITYPDENNQTLKIYEKRILELEIKLKEIANRISVYDIEEGILLDNSLLSRKEEGAILSDIKEASAFYREKLNEIKQAKLELSLEAFDIKEKIQNTYIELNSIISQENKPYSRITFIIDCETKLSTDFTVTYFVPSAGWLPLYDFRVNELNQPLNLIYSANIFQSTGENWDDVNLTLSTNSPSLNNEKPVLDTWFIDRRKTTGPKVISDGHGSLQGKITDDATGETIPFVNVVAYQDGNLITGAVSDMDGRYNIKPLKKGFYDIKASFVGYHSKLIEDVMLEPDRITFQDIKLSQSATLLEHVEIVEYKVPLLQKDRMTSGTIVTSDEIAKMPGRSSGNIAERVGGIRGSYSQEVVLVDGYEASENMAGIEYKIDQPYSIPSDGNDYTVKIKEVRIPVEYMYLAIPKLDKDAFLVAQITDWERLDLLSGQSSIYYKGTFTGHSYLDANSTKDTLVVSLSRDKNIIIERTLLKERSEKQFIGNNVRETLSWSITIKNNKPERIKIIVRDQFPMAENKLIEIDQDDCSDGKVDPKTGLVTWQLELNPEEKKDLNLSYSLKYPGYMQLRTD